MDVAGEVTIGDIVNIFFTEPLEPDQLLVQDAFRITVGQIYRNVKSYMEEGADIKTAIYNTLDEIFGDHTVYEYVKDFAEIENEGLVKLMDLHITEAVGVALGVITKEEDLIEELKELPFVQTLDDLMLDYFLSWLDIHIGEFVLGEDRPNGDWSENGFLNFVYNVKVNEVVMIIGAIFMYEKVLEMIGGERLGYFFMDLYNDKLGETLENRPLGAYEYLASRIDAAQVEAMVAAALVKPGETGEVAHESRASKNKEKAATTSASAAPADTPPLKPEIAFPDFDRLDLRIGLVESCEIVPKSSKLLKFVLDAGALGKRTIFSGIRGAYPNPQELVGKEVVFVANLAPRKMSVGVSEGMILFAGEPGSCGGVLLPTAPAGSGTQVS